MSESVARKAPPKFPGWVNRVARAAAPLSPIGPALAVAEAVADRAPPKIRQKVTNVALSDHWRKVASTPRMTARGSADLGPESPSPAKRAIAPGLHLVNPIGLSLEAQRRSGPVVAQVARSSAEWLEQKANDSGRSPYLKLGLGRLTGVLDGVASAAKGGAALADWQIGLMNGDPETYRGTLKTAQTGLYLEGELKERAGQALEESRIPGATILGRLTRQAGAVEKKLGGGDPTRERIQLMAHGACELLKEKLEALRSNPVFEGGRLWGRLDFEMAVAAVPVGEVGKTGAVGRGLRELESSPVLLSKRGCLRGVEPASPELLARMSKHGRTVDIAAEGSDDMRFLDMCGAEASAGGPGSRSILLRPDPSKAAALEEFLHGTQARLGIFSGTADRAFAEFHVKDFMVRHKRLLGLGDADVDILKVLRQRDLEVLDGGF